MDTNLVKAQLEEVEAAISHCIAGNGLQFSIYLYNRKIALKKLLEPEISDSVAGILPGFAAQQTKEELHREYLEQLRANFLTEHLTSTLTLETLETFFNNEIARLSTERGDFTPEELDTILENMSKESEDDLEPLTNDELDPETTDFLTDNTEF